jgi:hypothetical protein
MSQLFDFLGNTLYRSYCYESEWAKRTKRQATDFSFGKDTKSCSGVRSETSKHQASTARGNFPVCTEYANRYPAAIGTATTGLRLRLGLVWPVLALDDGPEESRMRIEGHWGSRSTRSRGFSAVPSGRTEYIQWLEISKSIFICVALIKEGQLLVVGWSALVTALLCTSTFPPFVPIALSLCVGTLFELSQLLSHWVKRSKLSLMRHLLCFVFA